MVVRVAYGDVRECVVIDCGKFLSHLFVMVRVDFDNAILGFLLKSMAVTRIC